MAKTESIENLLARCVQAAVSPGAGILLYRICYWHHYAKAEADGLLWIAKRRATWMDETGLTLHQYKDALATLRKHLIVAADQRRFSGMAITFIRLLPRGESIREGLSEPENATNCTPDEGESWHQLVPPAWHQDVPPAWHQDVPPAWHQLVPPYIKGDTLIGDTEWEIHEGKHSALAKSDLPDYSPTGKEAPMIDPAPYLANKKPKSLSKTQAYTPSLESVWVQGVGETTGTFTVQLSEKHKGQLKNFGKLCQDGMQGTILAYVIKNWTETMAYVQMADGVPTIPAKPSVGFLLEHGVSVVQFYQNEQAPAPKTKSPLANQAKVNQSPVKAQPDDEEPISLKDVLASMKPPPGPKK